MAEDRQMLMIEEELGREGVERRIGELFGGGDIGFAVLDAHVVAVDKESARGERQKPEERELVSKGNH
jgi:hypothetical protein